MLAVLSAKMYYNCKQVSTDKEPVKVSTETSSSTDKLVRSVNRQARTKKSFVRSFVPVHVHHMYR